MEVFKIRQDGFKDIKKQMLIRSLPILIIAVVVGIVIVSINFKDKTADINVFPIVIPIVALSVGVGLYRGVDRQKVLYESYTLTISSNLVRREQFNTPTISLYTDEIQTITKTPNGSFIIKGKDAADLILVPAQMDNYAQLEAVLQSIQPLQIKDKDSFLQKYQSLAGLLAIGLMLCVYTVNNKVIVALTGTTLVAMLVWSFTKIISSKNVDSKTKSGAWWILLVLASIILVMIYKLTNLSSLLHQ
jgi:hypothetical protein